MKYVYPLLWFVVGVLAAHTVHASLGCMLGVGIALACAFMHGAIVTHEAALRRAQADHNRNALH